MKILELFAGIGAVAHAVSERYEIAAAIDINENAKTVYRANFDHRYLTREIASLSDDELGEFGADLWWMSPPCQPFTRRGKQQGADDPRAQPMLRVFDAIENLQPKAIVLENVVGFESSPAWAAIREIFVRASYRYHRAQLCSTMFGLPNARPRFFVVASRDEEIELSPPPFVAPEPLVNFLDSSEQAKRWHGQVEVDSAFVCKYEDGINVVDQKSTLTRCFTSAYGKSHVQSGSYLKFQNSNGQNRFRRLSPTESLRLLGFSSCYQLPDGLSARQFWKLIGNSVSVPCVGHVLGCFAQTTRNR